PRNSVPVPRLTAMSTAKLVLSVFLLPPMTAGWPRTRTPSISQRREYFDLPGRSAATGRAAARRRAASVSARGGVSAGGGAGVPSLRKRRSIGDVQGGCFSWSLFPPGEQL